MFHIEPTTFHGISSGSAIRTRQTETQGPLRRHAQRDGEAERHLDQQHDAGEDASVATSAAWKSGLRSRSSNQRVPDQKKTLLPKLSCTE